MTPEATASEEVEHIALGTSSETSSDVIKELEAGPDDGGSGDDDGNGHGDGGGDADGSKQPLIGGGGDDDDGTVKTTTSQTSHRSGGSKSKFQNEENEGYFDPKEADHGDIVTAKALDLRRMENIAIPMSYLVIGLTHGFAKILLNVYPIDLGASEVEQVTVQTVLNLPSAFKIVYGFTSDNFPIAGYRRKPYMYIAWIMTIGSMLYLIIASDLTLTYQTDSEGFEHPVPPSNAPSVIALSITFFLYGLGTWIADVMADSMVAEKAKLEDDENRGTLQSSCYVARYFGSMVATIFSTLLYNQHLNTDEILREVDDTNSEIISRRLGLVIDSVGGPRSIVWLLMLLPVILVMPVLYYLFERRNVPIKSTKEQCTEIFNTVCTRSVWQPMSFVYLYNLLQVSNAAWKQYLTTVHHFTDAELNTLLIVSSVLMYLGTTLYKYCFLQASWRNIFVLCILANFVFSSLQLLLIADKTGGISAFWFSLGDEVIVDLLNGIRVLPGMLMMVALCPKGSEGASFAMLTTVWNSGVQIAPTISTLLLGIWDVSVEAFEEEDYVGLFKLSVLTTIMETLPIAIICWLPHGREDLYALTENSKYGYSHLGGVIFLTVLFLSIVLVIVIAILNIVSPGWAGGS